jgi:glutamate racemase
MVSTSGVHSHIDHLLALLDIMQEQRTMPPVIHFISDGRDTPPQSGIEFAKKISDHIRDKIKLAKILPTYLSSLIKHDVSELILACTHYSVAKSSIQKLLGREVRIYDQAQIIPLKLENYLDKHRSLKKKLSKNAERQFFVTKLTNKNTKLSQQWFGKKTKLKLISL